MGSERSLYAILGIAPDASFHEIRRNYRAAIKAVHPDVVRGREDEAKQLTAAYARLSDPVRRSAYDRGLVVTRDHDEAFRIILNICRRVAVWEFG